jgi:hypothetical protein
MITEDMIEFGLPSVSITHEKQWWQYACDNSQVDEIIEEESRRSAQEPAPVLPQQQTPRNLPALEITLLEQSPILHSPSYGYDKDRQEDRYTVHGVIRSLQIIAAGDQTQQVDKGADRSSRSGHERGDENLDRSSL